MKFLSLLLMKKERISDAALRELEEEIGYSISKEQLHPLLDRILLRGGVQFLF